MNFKNKSDNGKLTMRRLRLLLVLCISFVIPVLSHAEGVMISNALNELIKQADTSYAQPKGLSMEPLMLNDPQGATILLGYAMYGQRKYGMRGMPHENHHFALKLEVVDFLGDLAKHLNYKSPQTGMNIDQNALKEVFEMAMYGYTIEWGVQNGFTDPRQVQNPSILNLVDISLLPPSILAMASPTNAEIQAVEPTVPESTREPLGRFAIEEDLSEINLLGDVIGAADDYPKDQKVVHLWDRSKPFSNDTIVGTWFSDPQCSDRKIKFNKTRDGYAAKVDDGGDSYRIWEVSVVKSGWSNTEKQLYWNVDYIAIVRTLKKKDGREIYSREMPIYLKPYRETWILQTYYDPTGAGWTVYKLFN